MDIVEITTPTPSKKINERLARLSQIFFDTPTYKKTLGLALFYVFLFYLPFTILNIFFHQIVFFQLDHLYQYSSIVFDFQNKLFNGDFSTWDWKNAMGYDYFANFYYISLDFSILPFLLFPFLSYSSQMWLSFLLKILVGTAVFSYLLKTYGVSHRTNLFMSVLYGTADLFLAQNVFPSFTGIIVYIPLILLAIEWILRKRNYFLLSLCVFSMFLNNFYWAWPLSLFFVIALFIRLMIKDDSFIQTIKTVLKSLVFYLLGLGLAGFLLLPVIGIMLNEPRAGTSGELSLLSLLTYNKMVYLKTIYKMMVPNLFAYRGYFYDSTQNYFLPTNHIIIYSSILATYTLVHLILYPPFLVKKKLDPKRYRLYLFILGTTIIFFLALFIPIVAMIFSGTTIPYLRFFAFFGVILILNLTFLYEHDLINNKLLFLMLSGTLAYLYFARYYNDLPHVYNSSFHYTEDNINLAFLIAYGICVLIVIILFKHRNRFSLILLAERLTLMALMIGLMMGQSYSNGVRHHDLYGKEMNRLLKNLPPLDYQLTHHFIYYDDNDDLHPLNNASYLDRTITHGASDTFHSLINPYYKPYNETQHRRLYRLTNVPMFYNLYIEPNQWVVSQLDDHPIINYQTDPNSIRVASRHVPQLKSTISVYRKEKELPLGAGFTTYYDTNKSNSYYNYLWLDALYVNDDEILQKIKDHAFSEQTLTKTKHLTSLLDYEYEQITCLESDTDCENPKDYYPKKLYGKPHFGEYHVNITRDDADLVFVEYGSRSYEAIDILLFVDQNDQMYRCYTTFCHVPETGIKTIIIGADSDYVPRRSNIWLVNRESLQERFEELKRNGTYNVTIDGNTITSYVNNKEPLIMNYKVGYAPGWTVWVDGKKVDTFSAQGGLLSFFLLETGEHEIILKYETPGLKLGIILSFISFLTLGGLFILHRYGGLIKETIQVYYDRYRTSNKNVFEFLRDLLKEDRLQEIIRFGIIGVLATLLSFILYQLFLTVFHHNLSLALSYLFSAIFNFFASNRFTFKTTPTLQRGYRFVLAHAANFLLQLILLNGFIFIGLSKPTAIIPTYAISIPLNYFFVRKALLVPSERTSE